MLFFFAAPSTKMAPLLGHFLGLLLAHGAAQHVGAAERVAGQHLRGLHDLLLVDHDAVGFLEDRLEQRVVVLDGDAACLAIGVERDELHRPGAVERDQRDDVLDHLRLDLLAGLHHAGRFHLEDAGVLARG